MLCKGQEESSAYADKYQVPVSIFQCIAAKPFLFDIYAPGPSNRCLFCVITTPHRLGNRYTASYDLGNAVITLKYTVWGCLNEMEFKDHYTNGQAPCI